MYQSAIDSLPEEDAHDHPHLPRETIIIFQVSPNFMDVLTFYFRTLFVQARYERQCAKEKETGVPPSPRELLTAEFDEQWKDQSRSLLSGLGNIFYQAQAAATNKNELCCVVLKEVFLSRVHDTIESLLTENSPLSMSRDASPKMLLEADLVKIHYSPETASNLPPSVVEMISKHPDHHDKVYLLYLDSHFLGTGMTRSGDYISDKNFGNSLTVRESMLDNLICKESVYKKHGDDSIYAPVILH